MKKLRYFIEATFLRFLFFIFGLMPLDTASNIGGWIGRTIGPRLAASRKAFRNLENALPDLGPYEQQEIIADMWDNLGRVTAEYPHLEAISRGRVILQNKELIEPLFNKKQPIVFIGAHIANWEIFSTLLHTRYNQPLDLTYRAPNNPWVDLLINQSRKAGNEIRTYPKSRKSGKLIMRALKEGRNLGILIDQKYNEGIAVPFFGKDAMTNPVFVSLCQKYKCPLFLAQNERLDGANFKITIHGPIDIFDDDGKPLQAEQVIKDAHRLLEKCIKENPGQWLWLHRRWDSKRLSN